MKISNINMVVSLIEKEIKEEKSNLKKLYNSDIEKLYKEFNNKETLEDYLKINRNILVKELVKNTNESTEEIKDILNKLDALDKSSALYIKLSEIKKIIDFIKLQVIENYERYNSNYEKDLINDKIIEYKSLSNKIKNKKNIDSYSYELLLSILQKNNVDKSVILEVLDSTLENNIINYRKNKKKEKKLKYIDVNTKEELNALEIEVLPLILNDLNDEDKNVLIEVRQILYNQEHLTDNINLLNNYKEFLKISIEFENEDNTNFLEFIEIFRRLRKYLSEYKEKDNIYGTLNK